MVRMLFAFGSQTSPHSLLGQLLSANVYLSPSSILAFGGGGERVSGRKASLPFCAVYAQRCGDSGESKFLSWPCLEGVVLFNEA